MTRVVLRTDLKTRVVVFVAAAIVSADEDADEMVVVSGVGVVVRSEEVAEVVVLVDVVVVVVLVDVVVVGLAVVGDVLSVVSSGGGLVWRGPRLLTEPVPGHGRGGLREFTLPLPLPPLPLRLPLSSSPLPLSLSLPPLVVVAAVLTVVSLTPL